MYNGWIHDDQDSLWSFRILSETEINGAIRILETIRYSFIFFSSHWYFREGIKNKTDKSHVNIIDKSVAKPALWYTLVSIVMAKRSNEKITVFIENKKWLNYYYIIIIFV